jgi:hypothetical protein
MKYLDHLHYTTRAAVGAVTRSVDAFTVAAGKFQVSATNTVATAAAGATRTPARRHSQQHLHQTTRFQGGLTVERELNSAKFSPESPE